MSLIAMKENVRKTFGPDSKEFGWFMYNFSRRSSERTREVYLDIMSKKGEGNEL